MKHTRTFLRVLTLLWAFSSLGFAQTVDTSTVEKKARYKFTRIRDNTIRAITPADFRGAFNAVADIAVGRIPYITSSEFQLGKSDTARVVSVQNPINKQYFDYVYAGDTTVSTSDKDGQSDGYRKRVVGKRIYYMITQILTPEMFDAVGDSLTSDSLAFRRMQAFIEKNKGFSAIIMPNKAYYKAFFDITRQNVALIGSQTRFIHGGVAIHGTSNGQELYFHVSGIVFKRTSAITVSSTMTTNNAIEIWNAGIGSIDNIVTENYNAGIYIKPTGGTQTTRRVHFNNINTKFGNYGILCPPMISSINVSTGDTSYYRTVGDILISNSTLQWPNYDQIYLVGIDGLNMNNIITFSRGTDVSFPTRRNNIRLKFVTYTTGDNLKLFEAGQEALYCNRCENTTFTNLHIAWPGQRVVSDAILIENTLSPPDPELPFIIQGAIIDTPTRNGIRITGEKASQNYHFTGIIVNKIGKGDQFRGNSAYCECTVGGVTYTNPLPGSFEKHSIWADANVKGLYYSGTNDIENYGGGTTKDSRSPRLDGTGSYATEFSVRRGSVHTTLSKDMIIVDPNARDQATYTENQMYSSNSLHTARFSKSGIKTVTADVTQYNGLGQKDATFWIRDNDGGVSNTQKAIYDTAYVAVDSLGGQKIAFSAYVKPAGYDAVSMYINDGSKGLKVDFDVRRGIVGSRLTSPTSNSGHFFMNAFIEKAEYGYYRITMVDSLGAGIKKVRPWLYLKNSMSNPGNPSYIGNDSSGVRTHDWAIYFADSPKPYVRTSGTRIQRTMIAYGTNPVLTVKDSTGRLGTIGPVQSDGGQYITPAKQATYVNMISSFIGNRLRYPSQISSGTGWATSGSTDLGVVTTSDTIAPDGRGRVTRLFERTTTNIQRGIWNNITIPNTGNTVAQKWTGSIEAKYESGGIPALNLNFTNTGSSGSISYDIDLVNHRLIRKNAGTSGTYGTYAGNDSILVQSLPNGWYRYTATVTVPATAPNIRMRIYTKLNNTTHIGNAAYAGVVGRKVYLTRFNLEQADGHTEYAHNESSDTTAYRPIYYDGVRTIVAGTGIGSITKDAAGNWTINLWQNMNTTSTPQLALLNAYITNGTLGGLRIGAAAGTSRYMQFMSGSDVASWLPRFQFGVNSTAESGSNVGSDYEIWRVADDGTTKTLVMRITRSTGNILMNAGVSTPNLPVYADNTAALAGGLVAGNQYRTSTGVHMVVY